MMVIDLPDPDTTSIEERTKLRIQNENEKFDSDHYLADFFDDSEMIDLILKYDPNNSEQENSESYSDKEIDCLKSLPKKEFVLDKKEKFYAYCGLIDILFAYCYTDRINLGEANVEAGWTIAKLSATTSWLDVNKIYVLSIIVSQINIF